MLQEVYLYNTLETWFYAIFIAGGALVLGKLLYWMIQKTIKAYVKKTANNLDFIFVDMMEEPLSLAITLFGFWFAFDILTLTEGIRKFVDSIFYFAILFNIAWFTTRFFDALIEKYIVPKVKSSETDLDDVLLPIVRKVIKIAIWAMMLIIGIDNAGYNVTTMITGLGLGGLVFALAAKDAVANLFGGFVIFSDKPFSLHERIVIDGYEGFVREIGLRSTRLETLDGRQVTVPNSAVTDNSVLNISRERGRRIKFYLGLTYDTSVQEIEEAKVILEKIIELNIHTQDSVIAFDSFGDFSLNVMVLYWIKKGSPIVKAQDEINMQILKKFNEAGLNFAFPTQSLIIDNAQK
ncbi:MAG: mechanosensitive ion channel family protein [Campylobacterota bacterium]|nr:mechanosensitive ion channel family protein [Campylobacterota bacterium]